MGQIAHARTFDGVDDILEMAVGGLTATITAMTVAAIIKPIDAAAYRDVLVIEDPFGFAFGLHSTDGIYFYDGTSLSESAADLAQESNDWMIVAATAPGGVYNTRWHRYIYSTSSWTHVDDEIIGTLPTTPTGLSNVYIGGQTKFNGMIACLGYWSGIALSDGQLESIEASIEAWEALSPNSLWLLNQIDTAIIVEDRIGTSDEIARTGTTVTEIDDLAFDIGEKQSFFMSRRRAWR